MILSNERVKELKADYLNKIMKIQWSELSWMQEKLCQDQLYYAFVEATKYTFNRNILYVKVNEITNESFTIIFFDSQQKILKLTLLHKNYALCFNNNIRHFDADRNYKNYSIKKNLLNKVEIP